MKYIVSYVTFDTEAGANPFHHASLMLSKYSESDGAIEVEAAYGFYGMPSTNRWLFGSVKKVMGMIGLGVDLLPGNHGQMIKEKSRYLTLGKGLHELSIEVPLELYQEVKTICENQIAMEVEAQDEICSQFQLDPIKDSDKVFAKEQELAKKEGRESRLKPFHFKPSLLATNSLFSFAESRTCKTTVLSIFKEIGIPGILLQYISGNQQWPALPRFGGKLQPAYFYAEGPVSTFEKKNSWFSQLFGSAAKEKNCFRDWRNGQVKLFWVVPPQNLFSFDKKLVNQLALPEDLRSTMFQQIARLQQLECLIINDDHGHDHTSLIESIRFMYRSFGNIEIYQSGIQGHIQQVERFLQDLYFAMQDPYYPRVDGGLGGAYQFSDGLKIAICNHFKMPEIENNLDNYAFLSF